MEKLCIVGSGVCVCVCGGGYFFFFMCVDTRKRENLAYVHLSVCPAICTSHSDKTYFNKILS